MNPGVGPLFHSNPWVLRMQCKNVEKTAVIYILHSSIKAHPKFHNSTIPKIGLTHKKVPSGVANCRNVPFAGERGRGSRVRFPKEERCAESPPTFICGKRRKNRRKPVKMKILSSGVVFMLEEGISTSHVCPKGQQSIF